MSSRDRTKKGGTHSWNLVEDLYQALHRRGVRLILYWTGDGRREDAQAAKALGYTEKVSEQCE
jgi:hypothetical protein